MERAAARRIGLELVAIVGARGVISRATAICGAERRQRDGVVLLELAREALGMLDDGPSERRSMLEEAAAFYDFLAERMPVLLDEWRAKRASLGHDK